MPTRRDVEGGRREKGSWARWRASATRGPGAGPPITHGECSELKHNLPSTLATYYLSQRRREDARRLTVLLERGVPKGARRRPG